MEENKSSISQATSYREMGEFWDTHDVTDYWDQTREVEFEVNIESEVTWCALEPVLATKVSQIARRKGISLETLINLWVQEKVEAELTQLPLAS